jgi:hypothetical protein
MVDGYICIYVVDDDVVFFDVLSEKSLPLIKKASSLLL